MAYRLRHRNNSGIYGVIDQQLFRIAGMADDKGVNILACASASPSNRNLIEFLSMPA